eukprot:TRINITY_DN2692_c0_g1_i1.p1 TRINITY_DN2692_c0_g1~~TRINITY_DN2692_c0_g1_i1.p1  ORF type:complete len:202 (+),score=42.61 TRINITY_DN2692_c0_g1_i1:920-1525(+)
MALFGAIDSTSPLPPSLSPGKAYLYPPLSTTPVPYEGSPDINEITDFVRNFAKTDTKVTELTSAEALASCGAGDRLCVVAILPHLTDRIDGVSHREDVLAVLRGVAKLVPVVADVMWVSYGAQQGLESTFDVQAPNTLLTISQSAKRASTAYYAEGLTEDVILNQLLSDTPLPAPSSYKALPIVAVEPWNGSEFVYPSVSN